MSMSDQYVFVMKGKDGEYNALSRLRFSTIQKTVPFIELVPRLLSTEKLALHHSAKIKNAWRYSALPFFVDASLVPNSGEVLKRCFAQLQNHAAVPVAGPNRGEAHDEAISEILKTRPEQGLCYRIPKASAYDLGIDSQLLSFIDRHTIAPALVDLVLDLEYFRGSDDGQSYMALLGRLN